MMNWKSIEKINDEISEFLKMQIKRSHVADLPITTGPDDCCDGNCYLRFFNDRDKRYPIYLHLDPLSVAYWILQGNQDGWNWMRSSQSIFKEFMGVVCVPFSLVYFDHDYNEHVVDHGVPSCVREYSNEFPENADLAKSNDFREVHDHD